MAGFHYNTEDGVTFRTGPNAAGNPAWFAIKNGVEVEVISIRHDIDGAGQPALHAPGVMDGFGFASDATGRLTNVG